MSHAQTQSAFMSTSSQYYRSVHPRSHCQTFQSTNHDQTYATFVRPWQDGNHCSYAGLSSVPLYHYRYPQAGLSSDLSRQLQPPTPQMWEDGYARPNAQEWTNTVSDRVNELSLD